MKTIQTPKPHWVGHEKFIQTFKQHETRFCYMVEQSQQQKLHYTVCE